MIQLIYNEGRTAVVLTCDVCGKPIRDASMAMVRWPRTADNDRENPITQVEYCHKGACDKAMPLNRRDDPWWELEHFLARLVLNTGVDGKRFQAAISDVVGPLDKWI